MYNGSLKNFFLAKTTHRIPKVVTLLVASGALMAMVSIDASASAFGGRDSKLRALCRRADAGVRFQQQPVLRTRAALVDNLLDFTH
jgi:hypothetical protein